VTDIVRQISSSFFGWISRILRGRSESPKLDIDFGEVCFKREILPLEAESSDCRFDIYVFLYVWAANRMKLPTTIETWKFCVAMGSEKIEGERVEDVSTWRQHQKMDTAPTGGEGVKDIRKSMPEFPLRPLTHGTPCEGWLCFVIRGRKESWIENGTIQLVALDSFQHEHFASRQGPWNCKGAIVHSEVA
jgi:hypothetical protein